MKFKDYGSNCSPVIEQKQLLHKKWPLWPWPLNLWPQKTIGIFYSLRSIILWSLKTLGQMVLLLLNRNNFYISDPCNIDILTPKTIGILYSMRPIILWVLRLWVIWYSSHSGETMCDRRLMYWRTGQKQCLPRRGRDIIITLILYTSIYRYSLNLNEYNSNKFRHPFYNNLDIFLYNMVNIDSLWKLFRLPIMCKVYMFIWTDQCI